MLLRKKTGPDDDSFDRVRQDMLMAVKVSEDEINAAADGSPDLYDVLRTRIEAERRRLPGKRKPADGLRSILPAIPLNGGPGAPRFLRWTVTAAAILLSAALAILLLLPRQGNQSTQIAPASPLLIPSPPGAGIALEVPSAEIRERAQVGKHDSVPAHKTSHLHHRRDDGAAEVATDFLPLTFTADSAASESGHIVRIRIARTALIAFGLPMNAERTGELITADVVIGDDGLARAIRFIQ